MVPLFFFKTVRKTMRFKKEKKREKLNRERQKRGQELCIFEAIDCKTWHIIRGNCADSPCCNQTAFRIASYLLTYYFYLTLLTCCLSLFQTITLPVFFFKSLCIPPLQFSLFSWEQGGGGGGGVQVDRSRKHHLYKINWLQIQMVERQRGRCRNSAGELHFGLR